MYFLFLLYSKINNNNNNIIIIIIIKSNINNLYNLIINSFIYFVNNFVVKKFLSLRKCREKSLN